MFWRYCLFEFDEVDHLLEDLLPFDAVILRPEKHAEVVRHMLIDFGKSTVEEQIAIGENEALLRSVRHGHLSIDVELGIVV